MRLYAVVIGAAAPIVRRWGRLTVIGAPLLDAPGPILLVANHDSYWDPVAIGVAALHRRRIRALAKSTLWHSRMLALVLDGMGQLRITRGIADRRQISAIVAVLQAGDCVGIFPEGRISKGQYRRAYSGAGYLAKAVPQARVVAAAVSGTVDLARFPRRPRVRVELFEPLRGPVRPGESSIGLSRRVMAEIRARAPEAVSGRRPATR
jgi:1-acyl-sn-glycerol-3-phosphate acyltransferase